MTEFVLTLAAVFITAGALLLIANHLGFPPVPFYIIAGIIAGTFVDQPALLELALWGVAFLVFVFGTTVDLGDVHSVLRDGESAAFIQLIVVAPIAFVIGLTLGEAFGFADPFRNALYFSAAATLSSTLVGSRMLEAEIRNNLVHGRLASSIHFFDDIVAIGVLLVLSAEVLTDTQIVTSQIGYGVLFLIAGLLIYRHGYPLLIRISDQGDELILMGSVSILIAFLAAAEYVGISIVVGAFSAGIAVRSGGADLLAVKNGLESIKDFFAAIFFVTVGALVAVPDLQALVFGSVLVLLVVFVNPLIHTAAFVLEGYDGRTGFFAAASLNQISELSIVIAIQALLLTTIAPSLFDAIILAAALTMILSALTGRYELQLYETLLNPFLAGRTDYMDEHSHVAEDLSDHVIVVGFGRQGYQIVSTLETIGVPYVVIENDPARLSDLQDECENYVFGDAMATYPMERCKIGDARLVISTVDHRPVSERILSLDTDAEFILRADLSPVAEDLLEMGANLVVVPSILASDQLVDQVERVLGDASEIDSIESEHRRYLTLLEIAGLERRSGRG